MKILKYPDPILLKKAEPCVIDEAFRDRLGLIEEFMWQIPASLGSLAGLAAPQVGISERFFYMKDRWIINPEIIWTPNAPKKYFKEGCYSLEDKKFDYPTERHYSLTVKYQDEQGEWHEERLKGFEAQVFQHEYDHLEGKLCVHHSM